MTRHRYHVNDAITQIILNDLFGPVLDTKERLNRVQIGRHYGSTRQALKLLIPAGMVAMGMGVGDYELDGLALGSGKPLVDYLIHHLSNTGFACASVKEQGFILAEEEIQKRLLIIGAPGLPKNIEVLVIFVNLEFWDLHAFRPSEQPRFWQHSRPDSGAIWLRRL